MNHFNDSTRITLDRPLYEQNRLNSEFQYEKTTKKWHKELLSSCSSCRPKEYLFRTIPSIGWLSGYKWRKDFVKDLISGITVAIMHIPQGMAYALLGNVPPVVGMYMAFFPILIYSFLGTSRHNSMGTFAVVCLMTGKVVMEHSNLQNAINRSNSTLDAANVANNENNEILDYTAIQVATAVAFLVGIFQIIMYAFRLGFVSVLLSDTLVSGFTTGAAIHVLISQIKDLFGLKVPMTKGNFSLIKDFITIVTSMSSINVAATIVSGIAIVGMVFNNEILKPIVAKKTSFPIPIELIVIVLGTLLSKVIDFEEYNLKIIGDIASGLPLPSEPPYSLMPKIVVDCLMIAVVSYTITISMGMIFARKKNYEVDANQELLAMGVSNCFGSFFSCMPICASLSRSTIQANVGGKTQITSFVSCGILLVILLWVGPYFETLPRAILAAVIVVALKGMLFQVLDVKKFYKNSKFDGFVWLVTFLAVVIFGIDVGLLVGIVLSLATLFLHTFKPYACLLGSVRQTDLYLDLNTYKGVVEVPGLKIFHYRGGVNFATKNVFKSALFETVGVDPQREYQLRKKVEKLLKTNPDNINEDVDKLKQKLSKFNKKLNATFKGLILDFSGLSYIDHSGVMLVMELVEQFAKIDVLVHVSGCSVPVFETIVRSASGHHKFDSLKLYPTLNDAVQTARQSSCQTSYEVSVITRM